VPITPDTKDWTWVLERRCPECGLDSRVFPRADTGRLVRDLGERWRVPLSRPDAGERPAPTTWSPLEYGCHVRDVFQLYDERLALMLVEDDPLFQNWDQDATAEAERYGEQDPATVAVALAAAAVQLGDRFDTVDGPAWERRGRRSDGAKFTVESFARYLVHDPVHHLYDVGAPV
jgi:hypothetical protein